MKTTFKLGVLTLLFSALNSQLLTFGQGALTPPAGAPAPVMKSLAQIEPRTPISAAPYTINQPGSYYLTTNLTISSGTVITIATNDVTLDLNGFALQTTSANAAFGDTAIRLNPALRRISIHNGHIGSGVTNNGATFSGPGFAYGIIYTSTQPQNVRVWDIDIAGCLVDGINLGSGNSTQVESCTIQTVGGKGIAAQLVKDSMANTCGGIAIAGTVVTASVGASVSTNGIQATIVRDSYGSSNGGYGISATIVNSSVGYSVNGVALRALDVATACSGFSPNGTGLQALIANVCRGSAGGGGTHMNVTHNVSSFSN
jgi:hypothetical protein